MNVIRLVSPLLTIQCVPVLHQSGTAQKASPLLWDASRRRPSHTTGHTGPYHGGSIGLSLGRNIEAGKTEAVEIRVAQGLLDRRMS